MTNHPRSSHETFEMSTMDYEAALAHGLSVSGEDKDYFAQGRIAWLEACLQHLHIAPQTVMDYGCGTGSAAPLLFEHLGVTCVIGTDTSVQLLEGARRLYGSEHTQFLLFDHYQPASTLDLVFCNGVFHHIPPHERARAVDYIYRALRPGGVFSFWENNPWNPGTRYVMRRIPFDRDAITLTPPEARRLLHTRGFEILRTDFLFIFPRCLSWLRGLEPLLSRLPIGAQYQILCRRL